MARTALARRGLASLFLAMALTAPAAAALPPAQEALVKRVETYFNDIRTLEASFRQLAPDGSQSTGKLFIDRNRSGMRFDYDPPSKVLLVAPGDWRLIFYDGSIQQVNVIPHGRDAAWASCSARTSSSPATSPSSRSRSARTRSTSRSIRTEEPDQGKVVLTLAKEPMRLTRWAVTDAQGLTTTLEIADLRTGVELDRRLFVWRDPKMFGWPKD